MMHLLVLFVVSSVTAIICPNGYTSHGSPYCYKSYSTPLTYSQAAKRCQLDGAFLPTVLDSSVNAELVNLGRQSGSIWLGQYCDNNPTLSCYYQDGIYLNATGYSNFDAFPSLTKEHCVGIITSGLKAGKWHVSPCEDKFPFFCQYAAIRPQPGYCNSGVTVQAPLTISSPGYPNNYPSGISCQYRVAGPVGKKLQISFTRFALDPTSAVTLFNDGVFSANVNLWAGPQNAFQQTVDGNLALLAFDSAEATSQGFQAQITVV